MKSKGKPADGDWGKQRAWAGILYEDSAPEDWRDRLRALHMQVLISPLHDKDICADGSQKKPHYHVMLIFEGPTTMANAKKLLTSVGCVEFVKELVRPVGYARYLCHLDDADKAQYDVKDVVAMGGVNYIALIARSEDEDKDFAEMTAFIDDNHVYGFRQFFRYCRDNNPSWALRLRSNTVFFREYIRAAAWEDLTVDGRKAVLLFKREPDEPEGGENEE